MDLINQVLDEVNTVMHKVDEKQIDEAKTLIDKNKRIFILGSGRSGLIAKSFAMRLMQIGYKVFVIGETITPSIQPGDILVSMSGSGKTSQVIELTKKASQNKVKVLGVTSNPDSPLAKLSDKYLIIPGTTKDSSNGVKSIQLLSSLFDQAAHITLDILTLKIARRDHISNRSARNTHSNME